ncbi:MAG TPA: TIGR02281 family clan AA aspartic protease [Pseudolabrys sp.]|nr:TIGR02281 family clan AA aspartic protease [Pseudolabrys sp.]
MRQVLILAAALLVGGGYAARVANKVVAEHPVQEASLQPVAEPSQSSAGQHRMMLESDRLGHFRADVRVEGRHIDFMVDTGASLVALRESDAAMIGIRPMPSDYTAVVSTANGQVKAARAKLARVEIGDIIVYDVPALVLPDDVLATNLLGVSFLSRLRRYEYADGRLVLEQ